jgi:hypothetical protein
VDRRNYVTHSPGLHSFGLKQITMRGKTMKKETRVIGSIGVLIVVLTIGMPISFAQGGNGLGGRLEGTWNVRVTIRDCVSGAEIRSFDSLTIFMAGGTMIDSTSGIPQALKTPGQGIWEHAGGNTYRFKFKSFSFDAAGNFTGWTIIQHQATLNSAADAYISAGTAKIYSPFGNLLATGCSTTVVTRFAFD